MGLHRVSTRACFQASRPKKMTKTSSFKSILRDPLVLRPGTALIIVIIIIVIRINMIIIIIVIIIRIIIIIIITIMIAMIYVKKSSGYNGDNRKNSNS